MPSHEDYLDSLLKNVMSGQNNEPDEATPEEVLPKDILSDEVTPEDIMPEEVLPKDILPDEVTPEDIVPEDIVPEDIVPEDIVPEDIVPEDIVLEDIVPEDIVPEDIVPEDIVPEDIVPEDILPEDVLSEDIMPEEALLEDILSDEVSLESVLPAGTIPEDVLPDDIMFNDILSDEKMPDAALEDNGFVERTEAEPTDAISDLETMLGLDPNLDGNDMPVQDIDTSLDADTLLEDALADMEDILGPVEDLGLEGLDAPAADLADLSVDIMESADEVGREPWTDLSTASDLEPISSISEEEVERFLAANAEDGLGQEDAAEDAEDGVLSEDGDLLGMLEGTDDSDLLDIQDMLNKADNNEAVNEEIEALLSGAAMAEQPGELGVTEMENERTRRAREKKQLRQEKAAARKAAREEKAAAKAAAKKAKSAAKSGGDAGIAATVAGNISGEPNNIPDLDVLFDPALLDTIVSEADKAGQEETEETDKFADADFFSGNTDDTERDFGLEDTGAGEAVEKEISGATDSEDDMGFNMDSLFGDVEDSDLGSSLGAETDAGSAFPDFVDLDGQNVDAIMPGLEENSNKKKGLLARFFEMLTEEDEEEESASLRLSDENKDILNDLDKEQEAKKKKKKKIKKATAQGDEEDGEDGKAKAKKAKKAKKPKKPKPEKPKKEPEPEPLIPEKKLTVKKVMPVALVCLSLGILIIVFANVSADYTEKKDARDAYYEGDYQTCYENLYGKELNETEQIMFGTSKSILYMRLWMSEYEMFVESGEEIEALDILIQTVNDYPALYDYAVQWNAEEEVKAGYEVILNILTEKYGLTEEQAKEIAAVRSDYKYTEMVVAIVQGKPFGSWETSVFDKSDPNMEPSPMPDELPEEGELADSSFISNN